MAKPQTDLLKDLVKDKAAKTKAFKAAMTKVRSLRIEGASKWDELWEAIDDILEQELYIGEYRSLAAFVKAELPGEDERSTKRNALVARCFSPADEIAKGITFLEEVVSLVKERSGATSAPPAINLDKLTIAFGTGKSAIRKRARDATIDEVRKARRELRAKHGGVTTRKASPFEQTVRAALAKKKALSQIAVRAGASSTSFSDVPNTLIAEFGVALSKVK